MSKYEPLWSYISKGKSSCILTFEEIKQILGAPIDHAFLTCKKELTAYGFRVGKISMKARTVAFIKEN